MSDELAQQEELDALQSIYGDAMVGPDAQKRYVISFEEPCFAVTFWYPRTYPSRHAPSAVVSVEGLSGERQQIIRREVDALADTFQAGSIVMFEWLDSMHSIVQHHLSVAASETAAVSASTSSILSTNAGSNVGSSDARGKRTFTDEMRQMESLIRHSPSLTERKSKFVAHLAPIHSAADYRLFMEVLLCDPSIQSATHNISAYRIVHPSGTVEEDRDDDGETGAADKILFMMRVADVRNVAVCVTRWYGGVQLGPDRFRIISNCARQLLVQHKYLE
jgi:hypothetical protein